MRIVKSGILIVVVLALLPMVGQGQVEENYPRVVDLALADMTYVGEDNGDWTGYFASPGGDVNGDGLGDLIIGAPMAGNKVCPYPVDPGEPCPALFKGEGVAYLVLGRPMEPGPHPPISLADADASFLGCEVTSMTARQLYTAGDVNGDGYDDIFISGWKCGPEYTGKAYLILGRPDVTTWDWYFDIDKRGDASFLGENQWDFLSYYLATAGDVNGDGLDDMVISATHFEEDLPCAPGTPLEECGTCCRSAHGVAEIYDGTNPVTGTWTTIGSLATPRFEHTATLLPGGAVLVVGGQNTESFLASAETLPAGATTWSAAGSLATARSGHTATLLADGRVLVVGGQNAGGAVAGAELFQPATGAWTAAAALPAARVDHTATLLPDGRVLVVGGRNGSSYVSSAEIYNPAGGTWTTVTGSATARARHTATLLADGRVLVIGGENSSGFVNSAELYDPTTGSWTATLPTTARAGHTATLLADNRVLVFGGQNSSGFLRQADIYDPGPATWTSVQSPNSARSGHSAVLLPGGQVMVSGGQSLDGSESGAETFDPAATVDVRWWGTHLNEGRTDHAMVLLPDNTVLVVGGRNCTNFGKIYLMLGRQAADWGLDFDLAQADASFVGEATEDRIGRSVTGVGDVNGDGYDDFMIGSISSDYGGFDAGQNYLFLGRATPNDPGYNPARPWWGRNFAVVGADASFVGESAGDESGRRVAWAGDVNGDGYDDMVIGAARNGTAGHWAGISHLILGRPAADWGLRFPLASADASFIGEKARDQSGRRLSGAGDVNNDGYDDFVIGAPHNTRGGELAGTAYLILGRPAADWGRYYPLGQADVIYVGKPDVGVAGYDQGYLDDWNGDGIDDFLIAAYGGRNEKNVAGEVYVLFGGDAAVPSRFSPGIPHNYQGWRRITIEGWDPNAWQELASLYAIVGTSQTDPKALSIRYEVAANALYLWHAGENKWLGPCAPGDRTRLRNDGVILDCGVSVAYFLPSRTVQLELITRWLQPITLSTVMHAYLRTIDTQGRDSGFVEFPWPADPAIRKVSTLRGIARPGEPITYTVTFGNAGGMTATDIIISDTVPSELSGIQIESNLPLTPVGLGPYAWLVGDLPPLQGGTITMTAIVDPGLPPGAVFTNTATITATEPGARYNNISWATSTVSARAIYLPLVYR